MLSVSWVHPGPASGTLICLAGFIVCLLAASLWDIRSHSVPDLIWWIAALDIVLLICMRYGPGDVRSGYSVMTASRLMIEALFVIFIQERVMSRYYGRADSHAFSCCALFFAACGSCLEAHIIHMSISLILLTLVQSFRKNISKGIKLKVSVPFIPYISVSFVVMVILYTNGLYPR